MRPARSTVSPLATEIERRTLRCDTVGVSVAALVLSATLLTSCSMFSSTLPFAFVRGATKRL